MTHSLLPLPPRADLFARGEPGHCSEIALRLEDGQSLFAQTFLQPPPPDQRVLLAVSVADMFATASQPLSKALADMKTKALLLLWNPKLVFVRGDNGGVTVVRYRRATDFAVRPSPVTEPAKRGAATSVTVKAPAAERAGLCLVALQTPNINVMLTFSVLFVLPQV